MLSLAILNGVDFQEEQGERVFLVSPPMELGRKLERVQMDCWELQTMWLPILNLTSQEIVYREF